MHDQQQKRILEDLIELNGPNSPLLKPIDKPITDLFYIKYFIPKYFFYATIFIIKETMLTAKIFCESALQKANIPVCS